MNCLEYFLEKYETNLDRIVIAGGWAIEIFQDKTHNPRREHHDIDTLVLDENLDVDGDSRKVLGEYFGSINVESVDWLLDFIVEKQVVCKGKVYDVKVLCPEFIAVSKAFSRAFSRLGLPREKDKGDIRHIFDTVDLDREKIYSLIGKAGFLRKGSNFLELLAEKGLEPVSYSRDDFNKRLFQEKFGLEKIPEQMTSETMESYDFLFSDIKKRLGSGWIKNHKKRTQEILNNPDAQKARNYGEAIRNAWMYAEDGMKEDLADKLLDIPDAQKARSYGWSIRNALRYVRGGMKEGLIDKMFDIPDAQKAETYGLAIMNALIHAGKDMKQGLVDSLLGILDAQKAANYGWSIRNALKYAGGGMKEYLVDRLLGICDAQKAETYGLAIRNALIHTGKDMNIQQQIITNIFEDS